jgi:hypothetical protein
MIRPFDPLHRWLLADSVRQWTPSPFGTATGRATRPTRSRRLARRSPKRRRSTRQGRFSPLTSIGFQTAETSAAPNWPRRTTRRFRSRYGSCPSGYVCLAVPDAPEPSESLAPSGEPQSAVPPGTDDASPAESARHDRPQGMLPGRERRRSAVERGFVRLIATGGIVGIATILGAVLVSQDVAGWIVGLAVGLTSVILAALLWSSRQL